MIELLLKKKHWKKKSSMVLILLLITCSNLLKHNKKIKHQNKMMMILTETRKQVSLTLMISQFQISFVPHRNPFLRPVKAAKTRLWSDQKF